MSESPRNVQFSRSTAIWAWQQGHRWRELRCKGQTYAGPTPGAKIQESK